MAVNKPVGPVQRFHSAWVAKSDTIAFFLGVFLGPVGLWYKRRIWEGIAWVLLLLVLGVVWWPIVWLAMAVHAGLASPRLG